MHRDRLARIGQELLDGIFKKFGVRFVVHRQSEDNEEGKSDELMSIITLLFVASHNGKRAAANKRRRIEKQKQETKAKEKELKRIQDHNDRVTKGWTQEDITKRNSLEQSLERLQVEKTQKIRSAKKIANERAHTKNDLEKLFKRYDMITPSSSMKKEKVEPILRARRVKVTPLTKESDDKLRQWIGTVRWVYNQCVSYSREHPELSSMTSSNRLRALRDNIAYKRTLDENAWFVESKVPYDVYDEGIRDYQKAWSSNMAKVKKAKGNW